MWFKKTFTDLENKLKIYKNVCKTNIFKYLKTVQKTKAESIKFSEVNHNI